MLGILKKDLFLYVLSFLLFVPFEVMSVYKDGLSWGSTVSFASQMMIAVLLPVVGSESREYLTNGYRFLKSLPVTDREIVQAKHALPLGFVALWVTYQYVLLGLVPASEQFLLLSRGYVVVMANLCLLVSAGILYAAYRFGVYRFTRFCAFGLPVLIGVAIVLVNEGLLGWFRRVPAAQGLEALAGLASWFNLVVLCCAGLALYFLIMRASVRAKTAREE
jgi:hypothetical protein